MKRLKLIRMLLRAYDAGIVNLSSMCPHCSQYMGWNSHGKCEKCKRVCGCSFDPTSHHDWCTMHGQQGAFEKRLCPHCKQSLFNCRASGCGQRRPIKNGASCARR